MSAPPAPTSSLPSFAPNLTQDGVDPLTNIIAHPTHAQIAYEEEDLSGVLEVISPFAKEWRAVEAKLNLSQNPYEIIPLARLAPATIPGPLVGAAYKLVATMGVSAMLMTDPKRLAPIRNNDEPGLLACRSEPRVLVWAIEYMLKLLDERRRKLINDYDLVTVPGSHGSLLPRSHKRDIEAMRSGDSDDEMDEEVEPTPARKRPKSKRDVKFPNGKKKTPYSVDNKKRITGKAPRGLPLQHTALLGTASEPKGMAGFARALLNVSGICTVQNVRTVRYMTVEGGQAVYGWLCDIFGESGRKRLLALSKEAGEDAPSIELAQHKIRQLIAANRQGDDDDGNDQLPDGTRKTPREFLDAARLWSVAMDYESNQPEASVENQFKAHEALAVFSRRVAQIKAALNSPNPPQHLEDFTTALSTAYERSVGVGLQSIFLKWLCEVTGWKKKQKAMQELIARGDLLWRMEEKFSIGIFLFIGRYFESRFRAVPVGIRTHMFEVFNDHWYIRETCMKAWDVIGKPVIEDGTRVSPPDLKRALYSFLGPLPPRP